MKTNRSLFKLIVFSILTVGIYDLWFWSRYAKDMNIVCSGDGKTTRGIIVRILLGILTLGIYEFIWLYSAGERIANNSRAKGIPCNTTGGNVLLWDIFGILIIIGPFIAMYKLIDGLNSLCSAYNQNGNGRQSIIINNY